MALAFARSASIRSPEGIAWYYWQLGELSFAAGEHEGAERYYQDALKTFPEYAHAVASLGRVRAAAGDIGGAVEQYERLVRRDAHPEFIAPLGDLYKLSGRERDAAALYALVEQVAAPVAHENRRLALFYADHDLKPDESYARASKEYERRQDIYTADAVAWAALKAGKLAEARAKIREALRLGTQDAMLFYHAGMIERAAGDDAAARRDLKRALTLNPGFDPLQSSVARKVLAE
jgi:tetratricopeptide (TPR) repeat protein